MPALPLLAALDFAVIAASGLTCLPPTQRRASKINDASATFAPRHRTLLESLIGKLTRRLMQMPVVIGVRVKLVKLEIFDDCEVAIRMESGQW